MKLVLRYQQVASKMYKTHILKKNKLIRPYLPDTRWYDPKELKEMLSEYSTVFIKPDKGGGAGGLIRVELLEGLVECTSSYGRKKLVSFRNLEEWLNDRLKRHKRYIMQEGVALAKIDGRPFDLRIHMQKPEDEWRITGSCAKIAARGQVVTNFCKGGTPYDATKVIQSITSDSKERARQIVQELYLLSKVVAKTLGAKFKGLKELGLDIGLDEDFSLWIFEVNTRPCLDMFRKLENQDIYRKIKKIQQQFV